ncbi:MAG: YjzC family protein [Acholeplasmataceae bacterium]|nr:YjzC family protein [Acholeplasmataceae bacterium]
MDKLKPGSKAPKSADYKIVGKQGNIVKHVTVKKGNVLPPTPKKQQKYVPTKKG